MAAPASEKYIALVSVVALFTVSDPGYAMCSLIGAACRRNQPYVGQV